jgi:hypothetical protein
MYTRKTQDIFNLYGYYYGTWEILTAETTRHEIRQRYKEYRENEPSTPLKIKKTREKITINQ